MKLYLIGSGLMQRGRVWVKPKPKPIWVFTQIGNSSSHEAAAAAPTRPLPARGRRPRAPPARPPRRRRRHPGAAPAPPRRRRGLQRGGEREMGAGAPPTICAADLVAWPVSGAARPGRSPAPPGLAGLRRAAGLPRWWSA